jgi:hypothetical protein
MFSGFCMRFEFVKLVNVKVIVFWKMMTSAVDRYQYFSRNCYLLRGRSSSSGRQVPVFWRNLLAPYSG